MTLFNAFCHLEILQTDFLELPELSHNRLAREIKVPPRRINEIVLGKRGITADTALRLSIFFSASADLWRNSKISEFVNSSVPN